MTVFQTATSTKRIFAGLFGASVAATSLAAETTYTFSLGAISDDFLGRTEQYGILAFDSFAVSADANFGQFEFGATVGETFENEAVKTAVIFYDVAYRFGNNNWKVGVGQIERHWSFSEHTSLFLSRNAPAFPSAYIVKEEATVTDVPVLRWIGPWKGEFFIGETSDSDQPDDAMFFGLRIGLEPVRNLEIELVRMGQYGGSGQPDGIDEFFDVFFGGTNEGTSEDANQLAGLGASYRFGSEDFGTRLYGQVAGEDQAGIFPNCLFFMAGVENKSRLFNVDTTISLEHVDTTVGFTENDNCGPNTAYNNSTYSYRNEGVVMGAAIGSESRSTMLRGSHLLDTWSLNWNVGYYTINDASNPDHSLNTSRETGTIVSVGASRDMFGGTLQGIIAHQSFDLDTAEQDSGVRVGVGYSRSF